ncbi:MAG: 4Fe-4S cluster-binding domain-containing protein [Elusimicrobiota bacterium]|nr:4Fe-4S cluster-binding domain-containing protein [Elusimicrobiota bacterium]
MNRLYIPEPVSGGLFLSYKCSSKCKHCMYACSPQWKADWLTEEDAEKILTLLSTRFQASPLGPDKIGVNCGLHFTGGEPFLNFHLLLILTRITHKLSIPSTFVETNCFWATEDDTAREKLKQLKDEGLHGILISVNPFILEEVPFERTERVVRISKEVFLGNLIIYQEFFYQQFKKLGIKGTLSIDEYLQKAGISSLNYIELIPMGRAVYRLSYLYKKYPAKQFFGGSCRKELTRPWHVHIDNYGNYITGYCGGISIGNVKFCGIIHQTELSDQPILQALVVDIKNLYELGKQFGYQEQKEGYISKCHLCVDIRKHIVKQNVQFNELRPKEFYSNLEI